MGKEEKKSILWLFFFFLFSIKIVSKIFKNSLLTNALRALINQTYYLIEKSCPVPH